MAPRVAVGRAGENLRRGSTIETLMIDPSTWASCMLEMAASASCSCTKRIYAVPRLRLSAGEGPLVALLPGEIEARTVAMA